MNMQSHRTIFVLKSGLDENMIFPSNYISTSRYSILTFIPINLFEQFSRPETLWFFFVSTLQVLPFGLSPLASWGTISPLCFIVFVSMLKDAYNTYKRMKSDIEINHRKAEVIEDFNAEPSEAFWEDIRVGSILKLKKNNPVPADIVLLSTTDENGIAYVETSNLDGKNNFQKKQALQDLSENFEGNFENLKEKLKIFKDATLKIEQPNNLLYKFEGYMKLVDYPKDIPICIENLILRGTKIKNVEEVLGLVVFTGPDTKLMQNSQISHNKKLSKVQKYLNNFFWFMLTELVIFAIVSSLTSMANFYANPRLANMYYQDITDLNLNIFSFLILYNNLIPISLYVTLDVMKLLQALFVEWDRDLYSHRCAIVKNSDLNEELGQVEYIFTDKTGTLTKNKMEFKKCHIDGKNYKPSHFLNPVLKTAHPTLSNTVNFFKDHHKIRINDFWLCVSICHTVKSDSSENFQAVSPDEAALLNAAKSFGYIFQANSYDMFSLQTPTEIHQYSVIGVNEFTSTRKRMSIVVQFYNNSEYPPMLICKGADNIMFPRMQNDFNENIAKMELLKFAKKGLRTFVYGKRILTEYELKEFKHKYSNASNSMADSKTMLEKLADEFENNMELVGVTGVEDKVQDGVAETVQKLKEAGIKFWVLTGDKKETAENVAYSSGIISKDSESVFIEEIDGELILQKLLLSILNFLYSEQMIYEQAEGSDSNKLKDILEKFHRNGVSARCESKISLVVNGDSLALMLKEEATLRYFCILSAFCESVICSRISPFQKAQIIKIVKNHFSFKPVTLAIGDGSNDISMIQEANVGVGIMGGEGMQAANSSDYAVCKFTDLLSLLLVHGRWNYLRTCKVILLSLYKNFLLVLPMFYYTFIDLFSANPLYDSLLIMSYNIFMTALPIGIMGCMDRDVSKEDAKEMPELYRSGIFSSSINWKKLLQFKTLAVVNSMIIFFITIYGSEIIGYHGFTESYTVTGTLAFMIAVFSTLGVSAISMFELNMIFLITLLFSFAMLFLLTLGYDLSGIPTDQISGVMNIIFLSPVIIILLFLVPFINVIIISSVYYIKCISSSAQKNQEKHKIIPNDSFSLNRSEIYVVDEGEDKKKQRLHKYRYKINKIFSGKHIKEFLNKAEDDNSDGFKRLKYSQRFKNAGLEETFTRFRSDGAISYVRKMLILILVGILVWTVYDVTTGDNFSLMIARIALLVVTALGILGTFTRFFHENFNFCLIFLIICGLALKTLVDFLYSLDGSLSTSTGAIVIFVILRAKTYQVIGIWSVFLIIYLSRVFSKYSAILDPNSFVFLILNYTVILIGISLVSVFVGYYIEKSNRKIYVMKKKCEYKYVCGERIISRLLPEFIKNDILTKKSIIKKSHVTILFCEICNFDRITSFYSPKALIDMLNKYTLILDSLCEKFEVTKIETVNKQYVACRGLNEAAESDHAEKVAKFALAIIKRFDGFFLPEMGETFCIRIGINSGEITSGVVGEHKPQFALVGDAINIASRMCSTINEPNKIRISESTYNYISFKEWSFEEDLIMFKGRDGLVKTFFLSSQRMKKKRMSSGFGEIKVEDLILHRTVSLDHNKSSKSLIERTVSSTLKRRPSIFIIDQINEHDFKNIDSEFYYIDPKAEIYIFAEEIQWNVLHFYEDCTQRAYRLDFVRRNTKAITGGLYLTISIHIFIVINYLTHYFVFSINRNYIEIVCIIYRIITIAVLLLIVLNLKKLIGQRTYQWVFVWIYLACTLIQVASGMLQINVNYILVLECMYSTAMINHNTGLLFGYILAISIPQLLMWLLLADAGLISYFDEYFFIVFFIGINTVASWAREFYDRETYNLKIKAKAAITRNDKLLFQMIPDHVYEKLMHGIPILDQFSNITILYADICGFTAFSTSRSPYDIITMLSKMFSAFEKLCIEYRCYKVHTIGDCFVALGLNSFTEDNLEEKTEDVVKLGLSMVKKIKEFKHTTSLQMRIGIHTGNIIAGIVGTKIVRYDIYGPDVNVANLVETAGAAGKVNVSERTKNILESTFPDKYQFAANKSIYHAPSGRSWNTYFLKVKE